jgi:2-polyprenyl-6-methoxyphenol hydroxylase-like FAD-dependent oxidoreductase
MSASPLTIFIAGGGIGGLAAALSLAGIGARVSVFEKRSDPNEEGAGIQIGPNGSRILEQLGVADRLRPHVAVPLSLLVHDATTGERLAELPLADWLQTRHGAPYWVSHRADLHNALLKTVEDHPLVELHRGAEVDDAESGPDGITAHGDGRCLGTADCLIVADGLHSTLRRTMFDAPPPIYAGKSAARSVVAMDRVPEEIPRDSVGIWLAPQGHVVHYPVRGGQQLAIVVIRKEPQGDPGWATEVDPAWVVSVVSEFAGTLGELVAASSEWRKWSLYEPPPLRSWVKGRIALLGDAAHPVPPFLAQGAVLALEDAVTLAHCVSSSSDRIDSALAAYEKLRAPRAAQVQAASHRNGEIYHLSGPFRAARNMTLRSAPATTLMAGYDWLYGWRLDR